MWQRKMHLVETPEIRYATTADGVSIAYQVFGQGPLDVVCMMSAWTSNVELNWEWPFLANVYRGWGGRARTVVFDRRGAGLSDRVTAERLPTLDARMDDIRAVMDAVGSERAILYAFEDATAQCFLFAATYPERTQGLVALNAVSRGLWSPKTPWLWTEEQWAEETEMVARGWGTTEFVRDRAEFMMPALSTDPEFVRGYGRLTRNSLTKADALAAEHTWRDTDVRHVLPLIQAPTLVLHHAGIASEEPEESQSVAALIPGASFVQLERADLDWTEFFSHVDPFLATLTRAEATFDRVLATVLFTDIVGSTHRAVEMGDSAWLELLERHHATVRAMIGRYRGREVSTAGDGFFATFDGPARAIRCAQAISEAVRPLGIEIRAGLHTGEIEMFDDDVRGLAVHIGARVAAVATASEVLVSQTVKDLVAGSDLTFEDAGEHELKGVPDRWRLYRVVG
jgi:class 3 adenylate cyclase